MKLSLPIFVTLLVVVLSLARGRSANAQGIHFTQFYNAPMLVSVANTGLMSEDDYRINLQYRTQWGAVPVPFSTFMASGDFQIFRQSGEAAGWLGLGATVFTDKAGAGSLGLTRLQVNAAYHVRLDETQLLSLGLGVSSVNRKVVFSDLIFDAQWDGFAFNSDIASSEPVVGNSSSYTDLNAGLNYSLFPNNRTYLKAAIGVDHINSPRETFFQGGNKVLPRVHAMLDARIRLANGTTLAPSIYYSSQQKAWEGLFGMNALIPISLNEDQKLIVGVYHRLRDAVVLIAGFEYRQLRVTASYDYTVSDLGQYISHNGAFELGLAFRGQYHRDETVKNLPCPRF